MMGNSDMAVKQPIANAQIAVFSPEIKYIYKGKLLLVLFHIYISL